MEEGLSNALLSWNVELAFAFTRVCARRESPNLCPRPKERRYRITQAIKHVNSSYYFSPPALAFFFPPAFAHPAEAFLVSLGTSSFKLSTRLILSLVKSVS